MTSRGGLIGLASLAGLALSTAAPARARIPTVAVAGSIRLVR